MSKWLKRLALGVPPLWWLVKTLVGRRQARLSPGADMLLNYLAIHRSAAVPELSSRLKLPVPETLRLLAWLEQRGWVQLSADQGSRHVRIAAITEAGRERSA